MVCLAGDGPIARLPDDSLDRLNARSDGNVEDAVLLRRFCQSKCPEAFHALVERHIRWVQSVVRRRVHDRHLAEDATQAVFIILARKAHTISSGTLLSAWLFRVARFAANDVVKHESRHRSRIQRAGEMRFGAAPRLGAEPAAPLDPAITAIEPQLDDAIACLSESDRQVILLRFFEDKSMAEIGIALGISEVAAKKRVSRAVERLRDLLKRKGVQVASAVLILALLRTSIASAGVVDVGASSMQIARVATAQTDAAGRSLSIARSVVRTLSGAHARLLAAVSAAGIALLLMFGMFSPVVGQVVTPFMHKFESVLVSLSSTLKTDEPRSVVVDVPAVASEQENPAVSHLWIGTSNDQAWPVAPQQALFVPLLTRSISGADEPVAIAEDQQGQFWYTRIEPATVASALQKTDDRQDDYDELNPHALHENAAIDELIGSASYDINSGVMLAGSGTGKWQPVEQSARDGKVVLPFAGLNGGTDPGIAPSVQVVPEPGAPAFLLLLGCLLMRRRTPLESVGI